MILTPKLLYSESHKWSLWTKQLPTSTSNYDENEGAADVTRTYYSVIPILPYNS